MAGETNPTGPSPMTDTDAGKRLSDAELVSALRIKADVIHMGEKIAWGSECELMHFAADALERLTANRGSVSEERARELLAAELIRDFKPLRPFASMLRDPRYGRGPAQIRLPAIVERAVTAIQQAVSECSGGGAEEITTAMYEAGKQASAQWGPLGNWLGRYQLEPIYKAMRRAALPLPPSPVKESRDAFKCAYNDLGLHRCTAYPLGDSGYFGCRTVGCPKFPVASSTPHQGGEGK